jgi:hypothetical protein
VLTTSATQGYPSGSGLGCLEETINFSGAGEWEGDQVVWYSPNGGTVDLTGRSMTMWVYVASTTVVLTPQLFFNSMPAGSGDWYKTYPGDISPPGTNGWVQYTLSATTADVPTPWIPSQVSWLGIQFQATNYAVGTAVIYVDDITIE